LFQKFHLLIFGLTSLRFVPYCFIMPHKELPSDLTEEITPENCGEKLKLILELSGMTLQQLADALGVNKSTISHVKEKGREAPVSLLNALRAVASLRTNDAADKKPRVGTLTAAEVVRGLGVFAKVALLGRPAMVGAVLGAAAAGAAAAMAGSIFGGAGITFGVIAALKKIGEKNGLCVRDAGDSIEIVKDLQSKNDES
jgi:transcriptional regulator with XRE-family HTH domain